MSNRARATRKTTLNKDKAWIFGICARLADYLKLDPAIVRVIGIVGALFMPKIMVAGYLLAWLILEDKFRPR
ncbi:MAG: PspC domain-containing protein [Pseudomonadales bacterium]|nr:PspC domain-containing protein [Pseudomonadales bacterium]